MISALLPGSRAIVLGMDTGSRARVRQLLHTQKSGAPRAPYSVYSRDAWLDGDSKLSFDEAEAVAERIAAKCHRPVSRVLKQLLLFCTRA